MKLLGLLLIVSICLSCESPQSVNQRDAAIYGILQEATAKQQQDFDFFTKVILKDVHPDSLVSKNNQMIQSKANQLTANIQKLVTALLTQAGKGTQPQTKLPNRPNEMKLTAKLLQQELTAIEQSLIAYVKLLQKIGQGIPLPDLKTWKADMYTQYFEGATLMKSLIMLQQIKNDVWHNANLVSQRTS